MGDPLKIFIWICSSYLEGFMVLVNRGVAVPVPAGLYSPNYPTQWNNSKPGKICAFSRTYHPPEALVYNWNTALTLYWRTRSIVLGFPYDQKVARLVQFWNVWFLAQNWPLLELDQPGTLLVIRKPQNDTGWPSIKCQDCNSVLCKWFRWIVPSA